MEREKSDQEEYEENYRDQVWTMPEPDDPIGM